MGTNVTQTLLATIYKDVLGDFNSKEEFLWRHRGRFVHYLQTAVSQGLLDPRLSRRHFRLEKLSYALEPRRDEDLSAEEILHLKLLKKGAKILETPQYYFMRLAMQGALGSPNPTRKALDLYNETAAHPGRVYPVDIFNNQRLLFDTTRPIKEAGHTHVPEHYYEHGWLVPNITVNDEFEAIRWQEDFINSIDSSRLPMQKLFGKRIQLAKADQIPVCDDIVATSFQVLHFDMGHPFMESQNQLFVSHVGIYLPKTTRHAITARTRLVEMDGLLKHLSLAPEIIAKKIRAYVRKYGDGWEGHNTYRIACFIRFLDALKDKPELADQIDKTVGQWFENEHKVKGASAHQKELDFYAKHGIDLGELEHQIALKPGQILILDNTRVIHGRIGKRRTKELCNFMWGIEKISPRDISYLRQYICQLLS